MKRLLLFSIIILTNSVMLLPVHATKIFTDVDETSEYYDAIKYVKDQKIVDGYGDGSFKPNEKITRDAFTKIIINSKVPKAEIDACNSSIFPDVPSDNKFIKYICIAKTKNIVNGYTGGNFGPTDLVASGQSAKIIANTYNGSAIPSTDINNKFKPYVDYLANKKAIPTTILDIEYKITRGEMVEMMYRLLAKIETKHNKNYANLTGSSTCEVSAWTTSTDDVPTFSTVNNSSDNVMLPDNRLKQTVLSKDGKTLYSRYIAWTGNSHNRSWGTISDWTNRSMDLPDSSLIYKSFDHVLFPNNELKQTALLSDGKTLYVRYLQWDGKDWTIGKWEKRTQDFPNNTSAFASFDHTMLPNKKLQQSALSTDGKLYVRYIDWEGTSTTAKWGTISQWVIKNEYLPTISNPKSFDSVVFPNGEMKLSVLKSTGETLYYKYLDSEFEYNACK